MTALAQATITAILISTAAFPQQVAATPRSQAKQTSAADSWSDITCIDRPPKFFEMTWMFQDTSCHQYSLNWTLNSITLAPMVFCCKGQRCWQHLASCSEREVR